MKRVLILFGVAALGGATLPGETRYWRLDEASEFMEGKRLNGVIVSSDGSLRVGPGTRVLALKDEPSAWSGVRMEDGTCYVGTGRGKIYRIRGMKFEEVFDTGAPLVSSMVTRQGEIYAGTLGEGRIFRMAADGSWSEYVRLKSKNIWALAISPRGTLYAATGSRAAVYRIRSPEDVQVVYTPRCERVLSLTLIGSGHLLLGTMNPAQLTRLRGREAKVLYDFGDGEVRSIVVRNGDIYAAYNAKTGALPHELLKAFIPGPKKEKPAKSEKSQEGRKPGKKPAEEEQKDGPRKGEEKHEKPEKKNETDEFISVFDDITGTWKAWVKPEGETKREEAEMVLKNTDGRVQGRIKFRSGAQSLEIEMTGTYDSVTKTLSIGGSKELSEEGIRGTIEFTIQARLAEVDTLRGTIRVRVTAGDKQMMRKGEFEARRVEKPASEKAKEKPGERQPPKGPRSRPPIPPKTAPTPNLISPPKSAIWRFSAARTEELARFNFYVSEIAWSNGGLLAGTNDRGRVFRIMPDRRTELLLSFEGHNVVGFEMDGERLLAVRLSNTGKIAWIQNKPPRRPEYISPVLDTNFIAHWGTIQVRGRGKIMLKTRTANTARSDSDFTPWSEPITRFPARVSSPKGRYFQFRIVFRDPEAVVDSVTLAYRNENRRPAIQGISVKFQPIVAPGEQPAPLPPDTGASPPLGHGHSPIKAISWQANDADGDTLTYRLFCRRLDGKAWLPLAEGEALRVPTLQWDTRSVPDGWYMLRVVASDAESNPSGQALEAEAQIGPVLIDNTRPEIHLSAREAKVSGEARDATSRITTIEYSVDGRGWTSVAPRDGLLDESLEPFEIDLSRRGLTPGEHVITVRAYDQEMNIGVASVRVRIQ